MARRKALMCLWQRQLPGPPAVPCNGRATQGSSHRPIARRTLRRSDMGRGCPGRPASHIQRSADAAESCLAAPSSPTPQGWRGYPYFPGVGSRDSRMYRGGRAATFPLDDFSRIPSTGRPPPVDVVRTESPICAQRRVNATSTQAARLGIRAVARRASRHRPARRSLRVVATVPSACVDNTQTAGTIANAPGRSWPTAD